MGNKDFLKECIGEAIFSLMDEKDYSKITINDITHRAGVSRATWFRKFKSKENAIIFLLNKKWEEWLVKQNITSLDKIKYTDASFSFAFFLENKDYCIKMFNAGLKKLFVQNFIYTIKNMKADKTLGTYIKHFFGFAFFGVVTCWIERDFKESIPQLQEYIDLITNFITKK